jgi:hypothetical protein
MTFTVVWQPSCLNDLATLWTTAPDRNAVAAASDIIDAVLRKDPYAFSESRSGDSRIMLVSPLAVAYDVSPDDCLVTVWAVWRTN